MSRPRGHATARAGLRALVLGPPTVASAVPRAAVPYARAPELAPRDASRRGTQTAGARDIGSLRVTANVESVSGPAGARYAHPGAGVPATGGDGATSQHRARVYRAYLLKEELRTLYRCGPRSASEHLRSWLSWASRSNLTPFVKLGRTLGNTATACSRRSAYGFHSFAALAAMVFLCCTDLQLKLPV